MTNTNKQNEQLRKAQVALTRWRSKQKRAFNMIVNLEAKERRLLKALAKPTQSESVRPLAKSSPVAGAEPDKAPPRSPPLLNSPVKPVDDGLGIPDYLRRAAPVHDADEKAKAEIVAQQEEAKRLKAKARLAKKQAARAGDTKRIPLQGKAALAAINTPE